MSPTSELQLRVIKKIINLMKTIMSSEFIAKVLKSSIKDFFKK